MYIYNRRFSNSQYQPGGHAITSKSSLSNSHYPDRVVRRFLGNGGTGAFSPACDPSVATPGFSTAERRKLTSLLSPSESTQAIRWNRERHPAKSGARPEDITIHLARYA